MVQRLVPLRVSRADASHDDREEREGREVSVGMLVPVEASRMHIVFIAGIVVNAAS